MKKGLRESADEYDLEPKMGIYPISEYDTEIIDKTLSILTGLSVDKKLIEILRSWKSKPDIDVLQMLESLEGKLEQNINDTMKFTIDFIDIKGKIILVKTLFSIQKKDSYLNVFKKPTFKILINSTESNNIPNSNIEICFDDSEERDLVIEEIRNKLIEFTNIRFL